MTEKFCKLIDEAIKDETEAPKMYKKLRKLVQEKGAKKVLSRIGQDEKRHRSLLEKIKKDHCPP